MNKKIDRVMGTVEKWLFVFLMSLMTVVVTLQVIFRYVIHSSLPWSEELSRYCMVFVTYIGVSAGLRIGTHTCVDFLVIILPKKAQFWMVALGHVITLAIVAAFTVIGVRLSLDMMAHGQMTAGLHIPMWIPYSIIPVGFAGGCIRCLQNLVDHFHSRKENPEAAKET